MRKVPVLTMVSLAVIAGLVAVPVHAGTVVANDTPDFVLAPGQTSTVDLANFFDSEADALSYSATGSASVAGSVATILNSGSAGSSSASFTGTAGADSATVDSTVLVSGFVLGNAPAIDNNNRLNGVAGGNIFYNGIVPGSTVNSVANLTNIPAGGGGGSPGGATGGAALIASIASVDMTVASTGLRQVSRSVVNMGGGSAAAGGLTATLNADGSYSLAADASYSGAWLVTLGAQAGASASGVHLLAAAATAVSTANAADFLVVPVGTAAPAQVSFGANGVAINAAAGQGALIIKSAGVAVAAGSAITISADYTASSADISLALLAFDGAIGSSVSYTQKIGAASLAAGVTKNIAFTMVAQTSAVLPGVQVLATSASNVTVSNIKVVAAGSVADYALDPNATSYANDLSSVAGIGSVNGGVAPAASADNNFVSAAGAGSMLLDGSAATPGFANALIPVSVPAGSVVGECYVKTGGAGVVALAILDGAANNDASFSDAVGASWTKVTASGTYQAATSVFVVVQCAGGVATVDDLVVRTVADPAGAVDLSLLGL